MTTQEILTTYITRDLLSDRGDVTIAPDDDLLLSGLIDSVGIMSLVLFIETEFGVRVPPEDVTIEHFLSVRTMDAYLERRRANHA